MKVSLSLFVHQLQSASAAPCKLRSWSAEIAPSGNAAGDDCGNGFDVFGWESGVSDGDDISQPIHPIHHGFACKMNSVDDSLGVRESVLPA
jgi:hypothetical protein